MSPFIAPFSCPRAERGMVRIVDEGSQNSKGKSRMSPFLAYFSCLLSLRRAQALSTANACFPEESDASKHRIEPIFTHWKLRRTDFLKMEFASESFDERVSEQKLISLL